MTTFNVLWHGFEEHMIFGTSENCCDATLCVNILQGQWWITQSPIKIMGGITKKAILPKILQRFQQNQVSKSDLTTYG